MGTPFRSIDITACPRSHPAISEDLTMQAMWDERRLALDLFSNLTFDAVDHGLIAREGSSHPLDPPWTGHASPSVTRLRVRPHQERS